MRLDFRASFGAIAGLAAVAFRHPDGFDGLTIGKFDQVANRSIGRNELLLNCRKAERNTFLHKRGAKLFRQGRNLISGTDAFGVERMK